MSYFLVVWITFSLAVVLHLVLRSLHANSINNILMYFY